VVQAAGQACRHRGMNTRQVSRALFAHDFNYELCLDATVATSKCMQAILQPLVTVGDSSGSDPRDSADSPEEGTLATWSRLRESHEKRDADGL